MLERESAYDGYRSFDLLYTVHAPNVVSNSDSVLYSRAWKITLDLEHGIGSKKWL